MDVDMSGPSGHDYMQYFDVTLANFPWRDPRPREIEMRRAHMSDQLLFDILLASGQIRQPDAVYPPSSPEALQNLLNAIATCSYDTLKRDCLVYFLLKWHQDGREEEFKLKRCIPPQFSGLADAYWHLDSGIHVARAVSLLSDARINREHTPKIFEALSLSDDPHSLIRTYIRTAKPVLTQPDDIDAYTIALAESSLMEAWTYQRSFSEVSKTRERLVKKILDWCLSPKPRSLALTHLLAIPFSPYEQSLVHAYALKPPEHISPSAVPLIQDLVCVRLVQSGQHAAAIKLDRQFSSVPRGGDKGLKAAHDRRLVLDELKAAMPACERLLLDLELDDFSQGRGMDDDQGKGKTSDLSMSVSWEQIRPSSSSGVIRNNPASPIPQRSGAPRFGGTVPVTSDDAREEELFPSISRGAAISSSISVPVSEPQMPKPPSHGPLLFGGVANQTTQSANGWIPKTTNGTGANGQTLFGGISNSRPSLFATAGSANTVPNAFFQPLSSSSAKRPAIFGSSSTNPTPVSAFAALASSLSTKNKKAGRKSGGGPGADTSAQELDISMLSELSESDSARGGDSSFAVSRALDDSADMSVDMDASLGFSESVFGRQDEPPRRIATSSGARVARTETEARLPPGAFLPDNEHAHASHDEEAANAKAGEGRLDADLQAVLEGAPASRGEKRPRVSDATLPKPRSARPSAARAEAAALAERLAKPARTPEPEPEPARKPAPMSSRARGRGAFKRSVPGGFMDDEEDEDEESPDEALRTPSRAGTEEKEAKDHVAPLPTPARRQPPRKSRASNVSAVPAPTRRSSRLSAVSSVGSSSPEPMSPQKPSAGRTRKSARVSAATAGASASAGASKPGPGPALGTKGRRRKA